jgi:rifampicin phosphotransferase
VAELDDVVAVEDADGRQLRGTPASAGRVTGRARVVHAVARPCVGPGEILVVEVFDRRWIPFIAGVMGVVAERGCLLASPSIVAREYRVPVVLDVAFATARIVNGERLTVDGGAGRIYRR